jgi:hypothetical protein
MSLTGLLEFWHYAKVIGGMSALTLGELAGLAGLAYFVPVTRKLAIVTAITAVLCWGCSVRFYAIGMADKQAEWDQARAEANKQRDEHDANIRKEMQDLYEPQIAQLSQAASDRDKQVADYEQKLARQGAGACQLGADALRLRHH